MASMIGRVPGAARCPIFDRLVLAIRHCATLDRRTMPANANRLATDRFQRCIGSIMYNSSTPFEKCHNT
jgi:hypothetical protein